MEQTRYGYGEPGNPDNPRTDDPGDDPQREPWVEAVAAGTEAGNVVPMRVPYDHPRPPPLDERGHLLLSDAERMEREDSAFRLFVSGVTSQRIARMTGLAVDRVREVVKEGLASPEYTAPLTLEDGKALVRARVLAPMPTYMRGALEGDVRAADWLLRAQAALIRLDGLEAPVEVHQTIEFRAEIDRRVSELARLEIARREQEMRAAAEALPGQVVADADDEQDEQGERDPAADG